MAKKRSATHRISPVNPSLHYVLLLILALFLVIVVAVVMQKTAVDTRARILCPNMNNSSLSLESARRMCPDDVKLTKDANGCNVWVCDVGSL